MALNRPPTPAKAGLLAAAGLALMAACGSGGPAAVRIPPEFVCANSDLAGDYLLQTDGEVSARNLADLSSDAPRREAALKAAGLRGGRFTYWKQAVGRPPFDPPGEIVCQALEFATGEDAAGFVRDLQANPEELATTAITWLPAGGRVAEEVAVPAVPGLPAAARAFRVAGTSAQASVEYYAVVAANGRLVQSAYVGARGSATAEDAAAVLANLTGRTSPVAASR